MDTFAEAAFRVSDSLGLNPKDFFLKACGLTVDAILSYRESRSKKLDILSNKLYDKSWQYNSTILEHYVNRKIYLYDSDKEIKIEEIRKEIVHPRHARNIIITGSAGTGKSTVLKWLFLNTYIKSYTFTYLPAILFSEYSDFNKALEAIENYIDQKGASVVFIDGLDEFASVSGNNADFNKLVEFIDRKSFSLQSELFHKFVISTRQEHFEFHRMISRKNADMNLDNYCIYELRTLTSREALKICKTVKYLSKLDFEKNYSHFKDKWPTNKDNVNRLTEVEYRRALKEYIYRTDCNYSLLNYPVFCRYAYQIISDWCNDKSDINDYSTQSNRILNALKSYIKWEFHDTERKQTSGGQGLIAFERYFNTVLDFLTNIAGEMGEENAIEKFKWRKLMKKYRINKNSALCALQEFGKDGKDYYAFFHQSFFEYFFARYHVTNYKGGKFFAKTKLQHLLTNNSSFAVMYVEQMYIAGDDIVVRIFDGLANYYHLYGEKLYKKLADLASGNTSLVYYSAAPFTVEEYLDVFEFGRIIFAGVSIDKNQLIEICTSGILKIQDPDFLGAFNPQMFSKRIKITGVQIHSKANTIKYLKCSFWYLRNGEEMHYGGFQSVPILQENSITLSKLSKVIKFLLSKPEFSLTGTNYSDFLVKIINAKNAKIYSNCSQKYDVDDLIISSWKSKVANFLGSNNQYWCLYNENVMHFYTCQHLNEKVMVKLFSDGIKKEALEFSTMYANYCSYKEDVHSAIDNLCFENLGKLQIKFDSSQVRTGKEPNALSYYIFAHWINGRLYKTKQSIIKGNNSSSSSFPIDEVIQFLTGMNNFENMSLNSKIALALSDEKIVTLFLLNEMNTAKQLAEETINLCDKFGHTMGRTLREQLVGGSTIDPSFIEKFILDYLWISY